MSNRRKWMRIALIAGSVLFVTYSVYVGLLFRQLVDSFTRLDEFVPTRIYSDVTLIAPPQRRSYVLHRLQRLGYSFQATEAVVSFQFREIRYPTYLLPEGHPNTALAGQSIRLHFDGTDGESPLSHIEVNEEEVPSIYLEPEVIASLSRAGGGNGDTIRRLVRFEEIPSLVWKAIIAVEDQHFLDHSGLDPRGLARAIWINLKTLSFAQGGSTITQQLVKNLMVRRTKNVFRKFTEIFLSVLLEMKFEKEQILERYLNEVYLGQIGNLEIHGVAEGARYYFGKKLDELNAAEIAMIAGIIRGPFYYSPYRNMDRALERQRWVIEKMVETGQVARAEAERALKEPVRLADPVTAANKAPYFTDFVKAELIRLLAGKMTDEEITHAGFSVYTTLDPHLNEIAQNEVEKGVREVEGRFQITAEDQRLEGALASVDHHTGYIRALVGGKDYRSSTFNRILNMKRQVGSTFKPFVYLTAFASGSDAEGVPFGPGYPMEDAPWTLVYDSGKQNWSPQNYEKEYRGWIPLRTALIHSINTVGARLGVRVGLKNVIETARALGVRSDLPEVPSLTLGVAELSPIELLQAYATLANRGVRDELTVIRSIAQNDGQSYARFVYHPEETFPAGPIDLLTDVLKGVLIDGTARSAQTLGLDRPAAGKTGTTDDYRDSWFAGFTPELTTVVWVGVDRGVGKGKLTGSNAALPIWVRYTRRALAGSPPAPFPVSEFLSQVEIDRYTGKQADSGCPNDQILHELYIQDRLPEMESCESRWPAGEERTEI